MSTKRYHVVRIKHPSSDSKWVDVKVKDYIAWRGPNGQEMVFKVDAKKAKPRVIDETGGGNGIEEDQPTRQSHFEEFQNTADGASGQKLYVEILDKIAFISPNGKQGVLKFDVDGKTKIIDTTGLGIESDEGTPTRQAHIEKVTTNDTDTDDEKKYSAIAVMDKMAFETENGQQSVLVCSEDDEEDTTEYGADGAPPDNTDPNPYVAWPDNVSKPFLGKRPRSLQTFKERPPNQGILWNIVNMKGGGFRYFLGLSAGVEQTWDGGSSPINGPELLFPTATSPFTSFDLIFKYNQERGTPVTQSTVPSDFPGIVSAQGSGIVSYEHSITTADLFDDDFVQANWTQYSSDTSLPFDWHTNNDAIFNTNLMDVGDSVTFTVNQTEDGNVTCTFFMIRMPEDRPEDEVPLDFGVPGNINGFDFNGPFANLTAPAGEWSFILTRTGEDTWEFSGPDTFDYFGSGNGWGISNQQFAEPP